MTDGQGIYTTTGTFSCSEIDNWARYGFGVAKIDHTGNLVAGASASGTVDCNDTKPVNLGLSAADASLFPDEAGLSCQGMVGKPVNVVNGNMYIQHSDHRDAGGVGSLSINRYYNSMNPGNGRFGLGWTSELDEKVTPMGSASTGWDSGWLKLYLPDGRVSFSKKVAGQLLWTPVGADVYYKIVQENVPTDYNYTVYFNDGSIGNYQSGTHRIIWKRDRNGNQTTYSYSWNNRPTGVTDPFGRTLTITTNWNGWISRISDQHGVLADYEYYPSTSRLKTITYPDGSKYKFEYTTIGSRYYLATVKDESVSKVVELDFRHPCYRRFSNPVFKMAYGPG